MKSNKEDKNSASVLHVLIVINTSVFILLSLLHFYWAFGGTLWLSNVLPTNSTGSKRMDPGIIASFIISIGLLLLALITLGNKGLWDNYIPRKYFRFGALLISLIFFLRAVGDFKFVGFFKTITATQFAVNDTELFSPLCVCIGVISLLIFILNRNKNNNSRIQV